jgi:WD40 repeat protein
LKKDLLSLVHPEQFVVEKVRVHPSRQEAVTLIKGASLARWAANASPYLLANTFTSFTNFCDLAISPDGEIIAVAPIKESIEFRHWHDLSIAVDVQVPKAKGIIALAFSPDGRWLVLANRHEAIQMIDRRNGQITAEVEGGEWTFPLLFHPTAALLASACSFQGGGHIRLDRIGNQGELIPLHILDRSDYLTHPKDFVDSLICLAFSPDGQWLTLFETSSIYHDEHPCGWRGNVVLYVVETGVLHWQTSLDAQVTGDVRILQTAGFPGGFVTELLFVNNTEIACGATQGVIVFYDVTTGELTRKITLPTNAAIRSLSLAKDGHMLWVVLDDGKLTLCPL